MGLHLGCFQHHLFTSCRLRMNSMSDWIFMSYSFTNRKSWHFSFSTSICVASSTTVKHTSTSIGVASTTVKHVYFHWCRLFDCSKNISTSIGLASSTTVQHTSTSIGVASTTVKHVYFHWCRLFDCSENISTSVGVACSTAVKTFLLPLVLPLLLQCNTRLLPLVSLLLQWNTSTSIGVACSTAVKTFLLPLVSPLLLQWNTSTSIGVASSTTVRAISVCTGTDFLYFFHFNFFKNFNATL
jgi:hypothetical protein